MGTIQKVSFSPPIPSDEPAIYVDGNNKLWYVVDGKTLEMIPVSERLNLERRIEKLENALKKLGKWWLYWPSSRQIEGQPTLYESRTIQEIEDMATEALRNE